MCQGFGVACQSWPPDRLQERAARPDALAVLGCRLESSVLFAQQPASDPVFTIHAPPGEVRAATLVLGHRVGDALAALDLSHTLADEQADRAGGDKGLGSRFALGTILLWPMPRGSFYLPAGLLLTIGPLAFGNIIIPKAQLVVNT